ncbi:MAG TPA: glycosyltransferase family 2 protein [Solirubrobacteraceae bacterium]|nr:glycosyltransferase family 2 protein [Solirubrobacteraceae bacterium]
MTPRVSVLIGAYDNAGTLAQAIESMLAQTIEDLELLAIDDGSSDATPKVIAQAARRDPRVGALPMGRNVGIANSLNAGLRAARAPVVAVLDADDFAAPHRLERQLAVLDARPEVAVVGSRMHEVDEEQRPLAARTAFAAGDVNAVLPRFNPIPNTSAAFRREVILGLGGYDPRYRYATEYDLWLRVAERHVVVALDEPLSTRVMGAANVAARAERAQIAEALAIRARALARRRTLHGARGLALPALAWLTPLSLKRIRRRRLGQAP